jgi:hypothetical protein
MTISSQLDAWKANHPDYVIVFAQDAGGKETRFRADSDDQAMELVQRQYPETDWTLFRISGGERWHVHKHQGQPQNLEGNSGSNKGGGTKFDPNVQM